LDHKREQISRKTLPFHLLARECLCSLDQRKRKTRNLWLKIKISFLIEWPKVSVLATLMHQREVDTTSSERTKEEVEITEEEAIEICNVVEIEEVEAVVMIEKKLSKRVLPDKFSNQIEVLKEEEEAVEVLRSNLKANLLVKINLRNMPKVKMNTVSKLLPKTLVDVVEEVIIAIDKIVLVRTLKTKRVVLKLKVKAMMAMKGKRELVKRVTTKRAEEVAATIEVEITTEEEVETTITKRNLSPLLRVLVEPVKVLDVAEARTNLLVRKEPKVKQLGWCTERSIKKQMLRKEMLMEKLLCKSNLAQSLAVA
jgi:hypothetical protein